MNNELETLEKLVSFAFVMSENMIGLTKGNYDYNQFIKKTYDYLHKYNVDAKSQLELENTLRKVQDLESDNNVLLEENNELYVELEFIKKQYKELTEGSHQYKKVLEIIKEKPFESADCVNYLTINKNNSTMLDYKHYCMTIKDILVEEDFNTLKEVLE